MAELIDRKAARKIIEKYFETLAPSHYYKMDLEKASVYLDAEIAELPTTTEAEIRAKAIDEFAEKLKAELSEQIFSDEEKFKYARKEQELICAQNMTWKMAIKCVDLLADQLKEE